MKPSWGFRKIKSNLQLGFFPSLASFFNPPTSQSTIFLLNLVQLSRLLSICAKEGHFHLGFSIHASLIKTPQYHDLLDPTDFRNTLVVWNSLLSMYAKTGVVSNAAKLFDDMTVKDTVSWNTMMASLLRNGDLEIGFSYFKLMFDLDISEGNKHLENQDYGDRTFSSAELLPDHPCRRFSFADIKSATQNFDEALVIGKGGFGKVYKGIIDSGSTTVAIKRLDFGSDQGAPEFWTEIEMLSRLRHSHLVSLIGYCNDRHEMIIVYEYMPSGSLEDNLYKIRRSNGQNRSPLSWVQRLKMCLGAARGLDYLHTGTSTEHRVIHRDVKSSNILLDGNMDAKISDFGLSKTGATNQPFTDICTHVKGTFGYLDPEYFLTHRLTKKSDVYAFGVVLFEVLCGRPAVDSRLDEEQWGLAGWAKTCVKEGKIGLIVDPSLNGSILSNCLDVFSKTACECLRKSSKRRPSMAEVVTKLEFVLAMQEMPDTSLLEDEIIRPLGSYDNREISDSFTDQGISNPNTGRDTSTEQEVVDSHNTQSSIGQIDSFWRLRGQSLTWSHTRPANKRKIIKRVRAFFSSKFYSGAESEVLDGLDSFQFDFSTVRTATDNFAHANLIGQGGSGSVFKGRLQNGLDIAVKRLSANSGQDESVFKNEVVSLEKVRHKNLVRLLGFCVKGKEKLLIYEFAQNRSLDHFLSDALEHRYLNWDHRYKIIRGISRGLLYLHEEAPFQIIHRDIKPGNILLDAKFNPKISDFGLATLQKQHLSECISDNVIMGTPGYIAPECVFSGHFSVKSDVYAFGILLLQLISGHKLLYHFTDAETPETLLENAWRNWREGTPLNIADRTLREDLNDGTDVVRCIHIGLLCTQESAVDRPTMGSVLLMLSNSSTSLPEPSEPAFLNRGSKNFNQDYISDAETDMWDQTRSPGTDYSSGEDSISDLYLQ